MKAIKIEAYQQMAQYNVPKLTKRHITYPLPPYSTVIGMIHNACGWKEYHAMQVSVAGKGIHNQQMLGMRWKGGATARTETDDFIKHFPIRYKYECNGKEKYVGWVRVPEMHDYMIDIQLILHIVPELQCEIEPIYEAIANPIQYLSLGRHEDILRVDRVSITEISSRKKKVKWTDLMYYIPVSQKGKPMYGTIHQLNKNYVIKNNHRIFNKIPVMIAEPDEESQITAYTDTENMAVFLA